MHWRRKWQPTPVFLPGESQGRGSLVGCRLWGCIESDSTEATQQQQQGWKTKKSWVWWSGDPIHAVTLSLISYMTYVVFFNCKMGLVYNLPWRVPVWNQWDTYKMLRCGQKVWQLCSKFTKRLLLWNHWEYIKPLFWRAVCVWGKILGSNSWIFMGLKQKCHFVFRSLKSVWQELHLQMAILAQGGFLPIVVKQAGLIETAPCRNHDISAFV